MKSSFDFGFEGGVEVSEGIVAVGIEVALLFDVVLVVLLAYLVDAEENVDHAHFFVCFLGGDRESSRMNRSRGKRIKKGAFVFRIGVVPGIVSVCYYLCLEIFGRCVPKCEVQRREWFGEERENENCVDKDDFLAGSSSTPCMSNFPNTSLILFLFKIIF